MGLKSKPHINNIIKENLAHRSSPNPIYGQTFAQPWF